MNSLLAGAPKKALEQPAGRLSLRVLGCAVLGWGVYANIIKQYIAEHLLIANRLDAVERPVIFDECKEGIRFVFHGPDFAEQMVRMVRAALARECRIARHIDRSAQVLQGIVRGAVKQQR